jgi:hypothetical protein
MAVSRRYKFIVSPDSNPCLFDLEKDPFEMRNVFTAAPCREAVRDLARELLAYAQRHKEPYVEDPAMHADLTWAAEGTGEYKPPKRDEEKARRRKARPADEEGEP